MSTVTTINGQIASADESLDSLWAQAEYLGRVEIDRPMGNVGYQAQILLPDYSRVNGKVAKDVRVSLADAIRKSKLLQE